MSNIYLEKEPTEQGNYYFISYKKEDADRIKIILNKLSKIDVWYDFGIEYGKKFEEEIFKHINDSQAVILFVSNNSFKDENENISFVRQEFEYAKVHDKRIIVVYLEKIDAKKVPPSLWSWYQEITARESVINDDDNTDDELVDLIYQALQEKKDFPFREENDTHKISEEGILQRIRNILIGVTKKKFILCSIGIIILCIGLCCFHYINTKRTRHPSIYYTDVQGPSEDYDTSTSISASTSTATETLVDSNIVEEHSDTDSKSFSIVSYISNGDIENTTMESASIDITKLEKDSQPDIWIFAFLFEDRMTIYALNNGWGTYSNLSMSYIKLDLGDELDDCSIDNYGKKIYENTQADVEPGHAVKMAEYDLDYNKIYNSGASVYINICMNGTDGEVEEKFQLEFCEEGKQGTKWGLCYPHPAIQKTGSSSSKSIPNKAFHSVLHVEKNPNAINFNNQDATAFIDSKLRVVTVIAPDESCYITCHNTIVVNGQELQTDDYSFHFIIPYYNLDEYINEYNGFWNQIKVIEEYGDAAKEEEIVSEYVYDPESYLQQKMDES